jgi:hypothetical protein
MVETGLSHFQPLLTAEQEIIATLRSGDFDRLGHEAAGSLPDTEDETRAVRAEFLRFLLLGGEEGARPHEKASVCKALGSLAYLTLKVAAFRVTSA